MLTSIDSRDAIDIPQPNPALPPTPLSSQPAPQAEDVWDWNHPASIDFLVHCIYNASGPRLITVDWPASLFRAHEGPIQEENSLNFEEEKKKKKKRKLLL